MATITLDTEDLVSVDDAAEMLNISVITAWRWIRSGKLQKVQYFGRTLISKKEIAAVNKKSAE